MKTTNKQLADDLINEIIDSKMSFNKKMVVLKLLDKAFRDYLGIIFLSNQELEENDILNRSM